MRFPPVKHSTQGASQLPSVAIPSPPILKNSTGVIRPAAPSVPRKYGTPKEFFQSLLPYALYTQRLTGIPASVTLAQAALESGWGKHAPGNNFFGIKGSGPAGSQYLRTREFRHGKWVVVRAKFRRYHDPLECFLDHARVIAEGRHLRHAMRHTESAHAFVQALQSGKYKYASDPRYAAKILHLIQSYRLESYDRPGPSAEQILENAAL